MNHLSMLPQTNIRWEGGRYRIETILLHKHENIFTIEAAPVLFLIASKLDFTSVLGHLSVIMTSDSATASAVFVASLLDADRYRKKRLDL